MLPVRGMANRKHAVLILLVLAGLAVANEACAQQSPAEPEAALSEALSAACRQDAAAFANSLTSDNAAAYRALPGPQRTAIMKRFVLLEDPGRASALHQRHRPRSAALRNSGYRNGNALWRGAIARKPRVRPHGNPCSGRFSAVDHIRHGARGRKLEAALGRIDSPGYSCDGKAMGAGGFGSARG